MTDVDPDEVKIGDRVQMTFRRLFTAEESTTTSGKLARSRNERKNPASAWIRSHQANC